MDNSYKEYKKNAKRDLFYAIILLNRYNFEHGANVGLNISEPCRKREIRIKHLHRACEIVSDYILKKFGK